jgi:alginate O-acetyltransferase complex protein AlgI
VSFLSASFGLFVALGLLAFNFAPARARPGVLLALSLAFYCTWNAWHLLLLVGATAIVHRAALLIERSAPHNRKLRLAALFVGILVVLLAVFKYAAVLTQSLQAQWSQGDFAAAAWLAAPIGLSYYLFKLIGYLLDVYWEKIEARRDFISVTLYASFFPQIVSGPIQRAEDFFQQLDHLRTPGPDGLVRGLRRILFGLFKKLVVADPLGVCVAHIYQHTGDLSSLELLLGAYCFSLQMYADFSGLTDIAIGVGELFGITGPENFDRPYFARNLQDFWRRWHMSLTSWLGDYLFLPLRMSLRGFGSWGLAAAIFINMLAIGAWHGPRWNYLVFGAINGALMVVSALTLKQRNTFFRGHTAWSRWRPLCSTLITFHLVVMTHIFFRSADLHTALTYIGRLTHVLPQVGVPAMRLDWSVFGVSRGRLLESLAGVAVMELIHWAHIGPGQAARWFSRTHWAGRWAVYYVATLLIVMSIKGSTSFIYAGF